MPWAQPNKQKATTTKTPLVNFRKYWGKKARPYGTLATSQAHSYTKLPFVIMPPRSATLLLMRGVVGKGGDSIIK